MERRGNPADYFLAVMQEEQLETEGEASDPGDLALGDLVGSFNQFWDSWTAFAATKGSSGVMPTPDDMRHMLEMNTAACAQGMPPSAFSHGKPSSETRQGNQWLLQESQSQGLWS